MSGKKSAVDSIFEEKTDDDVRRVSVSLPASKQTLSFVKACDDYGIKPQTVLRALCRDAIPGLIENAGDGEEAKEVQKFSFNLPESEIEPLQEAFDNKKGRMRRSFEGVCSAGLAAMTTKIKEEVSKAKK